MIYSPQRLVFKGSPKELVKSLRAEILQQEAHFQNCRSTAGKWSEYTQRSADTFDIYIGGRPKVLRVGDRGEDLEEFPLRFKDGVNNTASSIFFHVMKVHFYEGNCYVERATTNFSKVINGEVKYSLHFDVCHNTPDHPDFHLQFESDKSLNFPRIDMNRMISLKEFIEMLSRDNCI